MKFFFYFILKIEAYAISGFASVFVYLNVSLTIQNHLWLVKHYVLNASTWRESESYLNVYRFILNRVRYRRWLIFLCTQSLHILQAPIICLHSSFTVHTDFCSKAKLDVSISKSEGSWWHVYHKGQVNKVTITQRESVGYYTVCSFFRIPRNPSIHQPT